MLGQTRRRRNKNTGKAKISFSIFGPSWDNLCSFWAFSETFFGQLGAIFGYFEEYWAVLGLGTGRFLKPSVLLCLLVIDGGRGTCHLGALATFGSIWGPDQIGPTTRGQDKANMAASNIITLFFQQPQKPLSNVRGLPRYPQDAQGLPRDTQEPKSLDQTIEPQSNISANTFRYLRFKRIGRPLSPLVLSSIHLRASAD